MNSQTQKDDYKALFNEYYPRLCIYEKRYIEDINIRKDIVSDVFVTLWDSKGKIDFTSSIVLPYLTSAVKNACLNYLRHNKIELYFEQEVTNGVRKEYENYTDNAYSFKELQELLSQSLNQLPPVYREVFIRNTFHNENYAQIAEALHLSVKSVQRYKAKTQSHLREVLKDFLPFIFFSL